MCDEAKMAAVLTIITIVSKNEISVVRDNCRPIVATGRKLRNAVVTFKMFYIVLVYDVAIDVEHRVADLNHIAANSDNALNPLFFSVLGIFKYY